MGPSRMGLCDWQCLTKGHWSRDVAYMLSAALTPQDRAAWERDLLKRYLERMGRGPVSSSPSTSRSITTGGRCCTPCGCGPSRLCHSPFLPAMQTEDTSLAMIERISTAMADLDSIDAALR